MIPWDSFEEVLDNDRIYVWPQYHPLQDSGQCGTPSVTTLVKTTSYSKATLTGGKCIRGLYKVPLIRDHIF